MKMLCKLILMSGVAMATPLFRQWRNRANSKCRWEA